MERAGGPDEKGSRGSMYPACMSYMLAELGGESASKVKQEGSEPA